MVGFEVKPESRAAAGYEIKDKTCSMKQDVNQPDFQPLLVEPKGTTVEPFSYSFFACVSVQVNFVLQLLVEIIENSVKLSHFVC